MKRMNLTVAVLLAALAAPTLAEDEPNPAVTEADPSAETNAQAEKPTSLTIKAGRIVSGENDKRVVIEAENGGRVIVLQNGEGPHHELNADVITIHAPFFEGEGRVVQPVEMIRAAFLGVNAKPLDIETGKRLGLKRSTGLLVTYAPGNGPAGTAGLKKGDVLTKLNDQILINAEQFAVLVRSQAIGDTVTLHGLRDGEPIELEAKLGEADIAPLGPGGHDLDRAWRVQLNPVQGPVGNPLRPEVEIAPGRWIGDGWGEGRIRMLDDPGMPDQVREMMEKLEQQMLQQRQDMDKRMQQLRQQLDLDIEQLRGGQRIPLGDGAVQRRLQSSVVWSDGQHKIRIANDNGNSQLTVTDREGKALYEGPLPEDGQVEGLPQDVQQKVDKLLNNTRIEQRVMPEPQPVQPERGEAPPQA
ncbi:MAG: PDZ domain-containing protein [Phycisphaeraceae bacterium]|nr:PDZ domain-containing protein [Phycisphaeraceae bacterium]